MLERAGAGLLDLLRQGSVWIVGYAARILSGQRSEFGLQVQRRARDAQLGAGGDAGAYARLVIVLGLAGGIESAKAGAQRVADVLRRALLLPRRAVEERGTQRLSRRYSRARSSRP